MNPLFIKDTLNVISQFSDFNTLINIKITCKELKQLMNNKIIIYQTLRTKYSINLELLKLFKNDKEIYQINLTQHKDFIHFIIFKLLLNKIIQNNQYSVLYTHNLLDLLFMLTARINSKEWIQYLITYINFNVPKLKNQKKIKLWNHILALRYSVRSEQDTIYKFNNDFQKFI